MSRKDRREWMLSSEMKEVLNHRTGYSAILAVVDKLRVSCPTAVIFSTDGTGFAINKSGIRRYILLSECNSFVACRLLNWYKESKVSPIK